MSLGLKTLSLATTILAIFVMLGPVQELFAQGVDCNSAEWKNTTYCQSQPNGNEDPIFGDDGIFKNILQIVIIVVVITSTIMVIIGGFKMSVSGGDPQSAAGGRRTLIFALIGLAIAAVAQAIVAFVLNRV